MNEIRAGKLLSENLTAIYGFAFARLYDKGKVDDLTSEIICEIMLAAKNIKSEDAFWGYAWKVAESTLKKFVRTEQIIKDNVDYDADNFGIYEITPEQEYIESEIYNEQIYLLRRELSLLSKTHREVCVAYYVDNKSCSEIADSMNLSVDMVKYHLFKTRKLLKEGMAMTRILGEKSYNPGTFRLNFWGDRNYYDGLFKRKLPGSIALAAYYTPMSIEELSLELGVSTPYLEDELEILEAAGILSKNGTKYQTNVVIITDEYEDEFQKKTKNYYPIHADDIWEKATTALKEVRKLDFQGNNYDDNRLLFAILNMAMVQGYSLARDKSPIGNAPKLPLGSYGWIWGHDNNYKNLRFLGVCMEVWNKECSAWFSAENYSIIERAQRFEHTQFSKKAEAMCDAILERTPDKDNETLPWLIENKFISSDGERLKANFPVFDTDSYNKVCEIIKDMSEIVADCMIKISNQAADILSEHAPKSVKDQCGVIAKIHHRMAVAAILMENLIENKRLLIPDEKIPLCVWGVR